MSKTIKIAAGDIYRNGRGSAEYVDGIDKHAQDLAYHQMTAYDADRNIGNELVSYDEPIVSAVSAATGLINTFIRECVDRFDDHQSAIIEIVTDDERLSRIRSLVVKRYPDAPLAYVYYLVTEVVSGEVAEAAKLVDLSHQPLPDGWLDSLNEPENF